MPSYKYFALVALLALSGTSASTALRGSDTVDERLTVLDRMSSSFDAVSQFLDSVEVNDESIEKIEQVDQTMSEIGPVLTQMRDTMFEESADEEEWSFYSSTLDKFNSVMGALEVKMVESDAFIDAEDDSSDEEVDESIGGEVDSEELIEKLVVARSMITDASKVDDLREAEEALKYVSGHLNGLEDEVKNKFVEATELLGEELNNRLSSFEDVELEDEETDEEVIAEEFIDALKYVQTVVEDRENEDNLREAEEVLDFVRANLNTFEGNVKNKFEEATELLGDKLNERKSFEEDKVAGLMSKLGFSDETIEDYLNEEEEKY